MENKNRAINKWINLANRASETYLSGRLKSLGLNRSRYVILVGIIRNEGLTQVDIASITLFDTSTITRTIDRFESEGLVIRRADPADKRNRRLFATEKARDLARRATKVLREWNSLIIREFPGIEDEVEEMLYSLARVMHRLATGASEEEMTNWEYIVKSSSAYDPDEGKKENGR